MSLKSLYCLFFRKFFILPSIFCYLMAKNIKLGDQIELINIDNIDGAQMAILRKMIGNYARKFFDNGVASISLTFSDNLVSVEGMKGSNKLASSAENSNLFIAVDTALRKIEGQL